MSRRSRLASHAFAAAALALAASASADFTIGNPGAAWTSLGGQNFSPSVEATPNPGLAAGDSVYLQTFTFGSSGQGIGAADTYLVIFDEAFPQIPSGITLSDPNIVGVSTNNFDTNTLATNASMGFTFDNLELTYGSTYAAVFATIGANDTLSFFNVGALTSNWNSTTNSPATNYGGTSGEYWNRAALWHNASGWYEAFGQGQDASFTATFTETVPEPASAALALAGLGLVSTFRRRRR